MKKFFSRVALALLLPLLVLLVLVFVPYRQFSWGLRNLDIRREMVSEAVELWRAWKQDFIRGRLYMTAAEKEAARKEQMDKIFRDL